MKLQKIESQSKALPLFFLSTMLFEMFVYVVSLCINISRHYQTVSSFTASCAFDLQKVIGFIKCFLEKVPQ